RDEGGVDFSTELVGQTAPDVSGRDGHNSPYCPARPSSSWIASGVSCVRTAGAPVAERWVTDKGTRSCIKPRYKIQAKPGPVSVVDVWSRGKRRPNKG